MHARSNEAGDGVALAKRTLVQALVVAAVVVVLLIMWKALSIFLIVFGGILLAVLFRGLSRRVAQRTPLSPNWALASVLLLLALVIAVAVYFVAPDISAQIDRLTREIPQSLARLKQQLMQYAWAERLLASREQLNQMVPDGGKLLSNVQSAASMAFGAVTGSLIVLVVGLFLAIRPRLYMDGLARLFPPQSRQRVNDVLQSVGDALESWLFAKIIAMLAIGVLTTLGLKIIGVELALILGVIAALFSFIPNIGPILALVPAVLLALIVGPQQVLYVTLLYMVIQALETYLITPLLQQKMVDLPPALVISAQILMGVLAGSLGLILATPLTAALIVLIRKLYIEDILEHAGPERPGS